MIIRFLLTAGLLYPTALALVIALDTAIGDAEFLQHFLTVSRKETLLIVITDWGRAAPYCLLLTGLFLLAAHKFGHRTTAIAFTVLSILAFVTALMPPHIPTLIPCALIATLVLATMSQYLTRKNHEQV